MIQKKKENVESKVNISLRCHGVLTNVIPPYFVHRCVTECLSVYYSTATQVWKAKAENDTEDCTSIFTI